MFIVPITQMPLISGMKESNINNLSGGQSSPAGNTVIPFKSIFEDAINNVKETDANVQNEIYKLATGQTNDLHNLTIASTKASLSVELLVQLRNKALESYNQVMNTNL